MDARAFQHKVEAALHQFQKDTGLQRGAPNLYPGTAGRIAAEVYTQMLEAPVTPLADEPVAWNYIPYSDDTYEGMAYAQSVGEWHCGHRHPSSWLAIDCARRHAWRNDEWI